MDLTTRIEFVIGDITQELSDAIVNPAGPGLVDQAVRQAAGPLIVDDLHVNLHARGDARLLPGRAIVTRGFGLAARHVIHCGPPVYFDGQLRARADLAACHIQALRLARERGFTSISFPAIGTGMYRFPLREAATIAVRTVVAELAAHDRPLLVRFVLADDKALRWYAAAARLQLSRGRGNPSADSLETSVRPEMPASSAASLWLPPLSSSASTIRVRTSDLIAL